MDKPKILTKKELRAIMPRTGGLEAGAEQAFTHVRISGFRSITELRE
jgi:hypothetical protein